RLAVLAERHRCLCDHAREWCAQLMSRLGREPLFATETGRESLEQPVERCRQLAYFVVRIAEAEATVEVAFAPLAGLPCHPFDRAQRGEEQPPSCGRDEEQ